MDHEKRVDPVEDFAAELRAAFVRPPADEVRQRHLMAMKDVEPVPAPARKRRRRPSLVRGAIAGAGLVLVGGSALAATGTLPDPIQNAVSAVAETVGIDIPPGHTKLPENPRAAENKQNAIDFVAAQRAWAECMRDAREAEDASGQETSEPAPKQTPCGEKPQPSDFREPRAEKTPKEDKTPKPTKTPKSNPSADRPDSEPADPSAKPDGIGKPADPGKPSSAPGGKPTGLPGGGPPSTESGDELE